MFEEDEMELSLPERIERMEIKSCPFCGGKPNVEFIDCEGYEVDDLNADFVRVLCANCCVYMEEEYVDEDTVDEVVDRWNKRVKE